MTTAQRLALALLLAMSLMPAATGLARADDRDAFCALEQNRGAPECKPERRRFQTRFF